MQALSNLIHRTGLELVLLADTTRTSIRANWVENLVLALVFIFGLALVLQGAWNGLLAEFPQIGRLSYCRAIHMIAVTGVVISIVCYLFF